MYQEFIKACETLKAYRESDEMGANDVTDALAEAMDSLLLKACQSDPELADVYDEYFCD